MWLVAKMNVQPVSVFGNVQRENGSRVFEDGTERKIYQSERK